MSKSIMLDVRECCLYTVSPLTHHTAGDAGTVARTYRNIFPSKNNNQTV